MSTMIEKIRAILAKTTAAGCTEAEAFAAAAMAQRLMDENGVRAEDLREKSPFIKSAQKAFSTQTWRDALVIAIANFYDCRVVLTWSFVTPGNKNLNIFGREADVLMVEWLAGSLEGAAKRAYRAYLKESGSANTSLTRNGFIINFTNRICARLADMQKANDAFGADARQQLVATRKAELDAAYALAFPKIRMGRKPRRLNADFDAYNAGGLAADAANLSQPLQGDSGPLRIGR